MYGVLRIIRTCLGTAPWALEIFRRQAHTRTESPTALLKLFGRSEMLCCSRPYCQLPTARELLHDACAESSTADSSRDTRPDSRQALRSTQYSGLPPPFVPFYSVLPTCIRNSLQSCIRRAAPRSCSSHSEFLTAYLATSITRGPPTMLLVGIKSHT